MGESGNWEIESAPPGSHPHTALPVPDAQLKLRDIQLWKWTKYSSLKETNTFKRMREIQLTRLEKYNPPLLTLTPTLHCQCQMHHSSWDIFTNESERNTVQWKRQICTFNWMRWICTWQREIHFWRSEKYSLSLLAITHALCWCPMDHIFTPFHHLSSMALWVYFCSGSSMLCIDLLNTILHMAWLDIFVVGYTSLWHMSVCAVYERSSIAQVCEEVQFVWLLAPLWEVRQKGPKLKTSFQARKTSPTCFFSPLPPEDIIPSRLLQSKIKE